MTRPCRAVLVLSTLACLAACATTPRGQTPLRGADSTAIVDGLLDPAAIAGTAPRRMHLTQRMAEQGVTAASVAIIRHNRVALTISVGTLGKSNATPVTASTLFQAASISKPFTAVATMRLVERGRFALDDSANALLRSWKIPANDFTAAEPVRVRHLLSHSAGATNGAVGIYQPTAATPTLLQALDGRSPSSRPPVRIDFKPGTRARYSGGGYSILQQLLIDVTGESFPALMSALVLGPMALENSCFCQPLPDSLSARAAIGHDANGAPIAGRWWTLPEMAAGGLWTTATDLARFVIAMNEAWAGERPALLGAAAARRMWTPNVGGYGLGFEVDSFGGELRVSHTGSNDGYRALMVSYPARGDGLVILVNGDGGADIRYELARAAARVYGWPGYAQHTHPLNVAANPDLDQFVGDFSYGGPNRRSTFTVSDGALVATYNGGAPQRLYSEARDLFFAFSGTTYRFERSTNGTIASVLVTFDDGTTLRARR